MPDLYSNCVILDFTTPITRAQLDEIQNRLRHKPAGSIVALPQMNQIVCAEREGNVVVPTIAADEC